MPQKKAKKSKGRQITLRLNPDEIAPLEADRKDVGGIPVSMGRYVKHAVQSYPKLRRLERLVRESASNGGHTYGRALLDEAGL